jgi:hypothetical protein
MVGARTLPLHLSDNAEPSSDHIPLWRLFILERKMKLPRRRPIRKAKTPKDLATQFLEWRKLRAEVSKAELAAAQRRRLTVEVEGNGPQPSKTNRPRGRKTSSDC